MENKNIIGPEEDLFQKSLHQEADFYKGMAKCKYGNIWSFSFAHLIVEILFFIGLLFLGILSAGIANAIQDKALFYPSFIFGTITIILGMSLFSFLGYKILKRLIFVFKEKNKKFRTKAIVLLFIPTLLFILIIVLIYSTLPSIGFNY